MYFKTPCYLERLAGQIRAATSSDVLPEEDTSSLFRAYAVLLLAKGDEVTLADVHNAWVAWTLDKGKRHDSLVPFAELPAEIQAKDEPFLHAVRTVAEDREKEACREYYKRKYEDRGGWQRRPGHGRR
jgi:hypothetical protein